ncbi:hypothetical protein CCY01nite_18290 [Chitinophaga cymbidii]|uniref:Uncharacterized protein n=2 Tax=Chitinophaga cymbidii TaxID=1096750 RepID=A0A512RIN1_9BACT|nr:hypothetical protein CCY01nite_18290 [Chitinophaga cymbidii]
MLDCRDSAGGVKEVYFIEFDNVTDVTEASGMVTAITVASTKQFRRYQVPKETSFWTQTLNSSVQNGTIFYQQELTIVANKMQANTRNELQLLAMNRLLAIVKDMNDKYHLLGWGNALDATAGEDGSGTATGDRNGYSRTFTAMERFMAPEVQSGIISGLLSPAA